MTEELTPLARKLIDILRAQGDWMSRLELGQAIGRNGTLQAYDQGVLQQLVDAGIVECETRQRGAVSVKYMYRLKPE